MEISYAGELRAGQTAFGEAVIGTAATVLGNGQSSLFDMSNVLEVELADSDHWLESRDEDALVNGANLAAVGNELIQFAVATPLGERRFRLSKLLRGRRGTEWAMRSHVAGEKFVMIGSGSLRAIELPPESVGGLVTVTALGLGDGSGTVITAPASGEALRPPSPVHLRARVDAAGALHMTWVRRSRSGWAWVDDVDAPLGETSERYRVRIEGPHGIAELETDVANASFDAAALEQIGTGAATLEVRQVGNHAL